MANPSGDSPSPSAPVPERLFDEAKAFAKRHGLDPLDVLETFVDLAWVRRGQESRHRARQAVSRWNRPRRAAAGPHGFHRGQALPVQILATPPRKSAVFSDLRS